MELSSFELTYSHLTITANNLCIFLNHDSFMLKHIKTLLNTFNVLKIKNIPKFNFENNQVIIDLSKQWVRFKNNYPTVPFNQLIQTSEIKIKIIDEEVNVQLIKKK